LKDAKSASESWNVIKNQDLSPLNHELKAAGLPSI